MRHLLPYLLSLTICFTQKKAFSSTKAIPNTEKTFGIFCVDLTLQHPKTQHMKKSNYFNQTIQITKSCIVPSSTNIKTACTHFLDQDHPVIYAKFYLMDTQGRRKYIAWNKHSTTEQFPFQKEKDLKGLNLSFEQHIQAQAQENMKQTADQMIRDELAFILKHLQKSSTKLPLKEKTRRKRFNKICKLLHIERQKNLSLDQRSDQWLDQLSIKLEKALNSSLNEKKRLFNRLTNEKKSQKEQIKEMLIQIIGPTTDNSNTPLYQSKKHYKNFKKQYLSLNQVFPTPFLLTKKQLNLFFQQTQELSQNSQKLELIQNKNRLFIYIYLKIKETEEGAMVDEEMKPHSLQKQGIYCNTNRQESPIPPTPTHEIIPPVDTSPMEPPTPTHEITPPVDTSPMEPPTPTHEINPSVNTSPMEPSTTPISPTTENSTSTTPLLIGTAIGTIATASTSKLTTPSKKKRKKRKKQ